MKNVTLIYIILLLLTPFINILPVDARFFDWQEFYFYLVTIFFAIINCIYFIQKKEPICIKINIIDCLIISIISCFFVRFIFTDTFSIHNTIFIRLYSFSLLYTLLRAINSKISIENVLYFSVPILAAILSVYGILQFLNIIDSHTSYFKVVGTFNNPSLFSDFLCLLLPILITKVFFNSSSKRLVRYIDWSSLILITSVIIMANERTAWIAGIVSVICLLSQNLLTRDGKFSVQYNTIKSIKIAAFFLIPIISIWFIYLRPSSVMGRALIYENTIRIIKDHFLFGIGTGKFRSVYNLYQSQYFFNNANNTAKQLLADNVDFAFNDYLQVISELGILGLTLIIGSFYLIFKAFINQARNSTKGVYGSILAIAVAALFSYPLQNLVILIYILLFLAAISNEIKPLGTFTINPYFKNAVGLLVFGTLVYFTLSIIQLSGKQIKWQRIALGEEAPNTKSYEELVPFLDNNGEFLYNYGCELSIDKKYDQSIFVLKKAEKYLVNTDLLIYLGDAYLGQKKYQLAEKQYLTACYMVPKKILPKYALMQYYESVKKTDQANNLGEYILRENKTKLSEQAYLIKEQVIGLLFSHCD